MALKGDVTGLDTLLFGGKPMVPLIRGNSKQMISGVISTRFQGGATRQRVKYYNNNHIMEASFYLESPTQQAFMKLFENRNQGKHFICYLSADSANVEPYVVQVVSEWVYSENTAKDAYLNVTLEITPSRSFCYDNFIYDMTVCTGSELGCILLSLKTLVRSF